MCVVARRTTPLPPKVPRPAEAQLSVPSHPESVVRVWGAFSVGILMLSPPPLCRRSRPGGGYRTCWIALSTARTGVRRALPRREGSLTARRSRPTPCRQPSTAAAGQGAQAASSSCLGMNEWRRGVERQARQSGGELRGAIRTFCRSIFSKWYKSGVPLLYRCSWVASRGAARYRPVLGSKFAVGDCTVFGDRNRCVTAIFGAENQVFRFPTVASRAQSATVEVYHPPPRTHAWGACANGRIIFGVTALSKRRSVSLGKRAIK